MIKVMQSTFVTLVSMVPELKRADKYTRTDARARTDTKAQISPRTHARSRTGGILKSTKNRIASW